MLRNVESVASLVIIIAVIIAVAAVFRV